MSTPVLVIATLDVHDAGAMEEYKRLAGPTLASHRARLVAVDDHAETFEGGWPGARTVVIEFESADAARAWYASTEYQAAKQARIRGVTTTMAMVRQLPKK